MNSIRALERGIEVLRLLRSDEGLSLHALHQTTDLPKPTLLRILHTLERGGLAWRSIFDGTWRRRVEFDAIDRPAGCDSRVAEVAAPHLAALQRIVLWPSDVLVYHENCMVVAESSRRMSGLAMNPRYHVGYRVDLVLSAPGRAWLAFCTAAQREAALDHYRARPPVNRRSVAVLGKELNAILDETRRLGYAVRDRDFGGSEEDISCFDDGLDAIAVPVPGAEGVLACINLVWPRRFSLRVKVVEAHLADLQATARTIAQAFDAG